MTTYSWTGPGGWTSNLQNPTRSNATLAMAGTYTLTVTGANGCTGSASTNVAVNSKPVATASSNSPVCEGSTIQLTGGPNGMTTYSWTGPGGWTSNLQNPTRSNATLAMAGTYRLTVTNGGCTSNPVTTSVVVDICGAALDPAEKSVELLIDADHSGVASPGDTLRYTVIVWNEGTLDATGVVFNDTPDPNTILVWGTVTTTKGTVTIGNNNGDTWISVDVGTLLANSLETVRITFDVTIRDPLLYPATYVENQGVFTLLEGPPVLTDDPTTPPDDDPTDEPLGPKKAPSRVPTFPSVYLGIAAALGAGILAYSIRRRLVDQK